jgi:hypothetical protein
MPTISMFYGVVIYLYYFDNEQHNTPHIHAKFQDFSASFAIQSGEKLAGDFPIGKARMVQAWIEIHREALMADWNLAVNGQAPFKIPALQ